MYHAGVLWTRQQDLNDCIVIICYLLMYPLAGDMGDRVQGASNKA